MEKKTPLYETHVKYKGKMVPFAGYLLPVQYDTGVIGEHMAVREACGLFDVSHMGEILCRGKDALANLNYLLTNDYTEMYDGQARYSPMCNEQGGVVDDLIVYKVQETQRSTVGKRGKPGKGFCVDERACFRRCDIYRYLRLNCPDCSSGAKGFGDFKEAGTGRRDPPKNITAQGLTDGSGRFPALFPGRDIPGRTDLNFMSLPKTRQPCGSF